MITDIAMKKEELIEKADKAIHELVYSKYDLQKAYNYYNAVRDKDQFRYLEKVYGVNTPTTINFTPLVKKHIDALIGEYLGTPILPKIYCKDSETLSSITRQKQLTIAKETIDYLKTSLRSDILNIIQGKPTQDQLILKQIKSIKEDLDSNFVS